MNKQFNCKAILFDMDGTITDTERIYQEYWYSCAKDLGYYEFTRADALDLRSLNGTDADQLLKNRYNGHVDYHKLHTAVGQSVREYLSIHGIPIKPGVSEILEYLHNKNIPTAIVTAGRLEPAVERLQEAGLLDSFDEVISAHDMPKGKPHPDPYLHACRVLQVAPSDTIAVEDSPNGVRSAAAAGCHVIMVPDLTEPDEELARLLYAKAKTLSNLTAFV